MMIWCFSLYWFKIITWISLGFGLLIRQNEASEDITLVFPHIYYSRKWYVHYRGCIITRFFFFYNFKNIYLCLTKSISYWSGNSSNQMLIATLSSHQTCYRPNNRLEDSVSLWWFAALTWEMQTFSGGGKLFQPRPWTFPQPNQVVLVQTQPRNDIVLLSQVRLVTSNQTINTCL